MQVQNRFLAFVARHFALIGPIALITVVCLVAVAIRNPLIERTITDAMIKVVTVTAMYMFIGNSGVISFGSAAFVAIGAYATAWQTCCPGLKAMTMTGLPDLLRYNSVPNLPAIMSAGLLAAIVGFAIGIPIMRLSGVAASIATLAVLGIVNVTYSNWNSVTLGTLSVVGLPFYVNIWIALAFASLTIVAAYVLQTSRFGIALRASREDEVAARSAGIRIWRSRVIAWTLSSFFLGIGGALYGHFIGVISVNAFYLDLTFICLAMLVVGGTRSLAGAVVGVLVVSLASEILRQFESGVTIGSVIVKAPEGIQEVTLGLAMLLVLIRFPRGLTGGREMRLPRYLTRKRA